MLGKILSLCAAIVWGVSCTSHAPQIEALCLRDAIGNYVLKWETNPEIEGTVRISVSDDSERFEDKPVALTANIRDGVATYITNDNVTRKYFRLVFNEKYTRIVSARSSTMDNIQNFRDMGGYATGDGKIVKWGKVFRSGQLDALSREDSIRINELGIRTIIDLRTEREAALHPTRYTNARIVRIPIAVGETTDVIQRVVDGKMRKGDAQIFMEDEYLQFVTDNSDAFAQALQVFLDADNYPILFTCSYGKDRSGFLGAMLLTALKATRETILTDYLTSNQYISADHLMEMASYLSTEAQESITVFLTADEHLMDLAFRKIEKEYGSTEKYLSQGLRFDDNAQKRLRKILLYD